MTFLGIVACQLGTGFAVRTETASLRAIGLTTNPLLLWGMAFEVAFSLALVYIPPLPAVFAFAAPTPAQLTILLAYPLIVWGVDELRKSHVRHAGATRGIETAAGRPDRRVMPM